jgi:hypothetical protein
MHEVQECPTESMIDQAGPNLIGVGLEIEGTFKAYADGMSMRSKPFCAVLKGFLHPVLERVSRWLCRPPVHCGRG